MEEMMTGAKKWYSKAVAVYKGWSNAQRQIAMVVAGGCLVGVALGGFSGMFLGAGVALLMTALFSHLDNI